MGESIAEGTIVRWIKKVGDPIDRDEPLFEISTDKVDAEIPSPGEGVLLEIRVKEGETVPVNSVVALIGAAGEEVASADSALAASRTPHPAPSLREPLAPLAATAGKPAPRTDASVRSSPVVRKIAAEHDIDVSQIQGTGIAGRVSKHDILEFIDSGRVPTRKPAAQEDRVEKMSVMRRKIAEHMVASVKTSPHVYSIYEVDFHRVEQLRHSRKAGYDEAGAKLTYTAFIARATVEAIRKFPVANSSLDGDTIIYKRDINLGIAVALEAGLIVPVIRGAASLSMMDLCRTIQDLAQRARAKQLKHDEVQGGTFTITNPGIFGAKFGLPIINQPQVAILAVGAIEKRPLVVNDQVVIRPTSYLSLGYDHRLIDGAEGGRFLQAVKDAIEGFDEAWL
jgi:2-oxoglutarate dehydrogenase E2 component (dihydrolipoamide succinyltransferase)